MIISVLVEIQSLNVDKTFSYKVPKHLENKIKIGIRVIVPFSTRKLEGFVLEVEIENIKGIELKEIIDIVDKEPILNKEMLELGKYMSDTTLCTQVSAYQTMLPTSLKAKYGFVPTIKKENVLILNKDNEYISKYLKQNKSTLKTKTLEILLSGKKLLKRDVSSYIVKQLLNEKLIYIDEVEIYRINNKISDKFNEYTLTSDQKCVVDEICGNFDKSITYLLHGVTGSGKTEVYMSVIEKVIKNGMEALVLVPEISLTPQIIKRFRDKFFDNVAVLHSKLSNGEKYDEYRKIMKKEVKIVIGARSAVFAPFTNIGVIIIDEEHVESYKQVNNPHYHAVDIAIFRGKYHNCPVVLGSATPTLESYAKAVRGVYKLLELPNRINNRSLPKVYIVDMKEENKKGNIILSSLLIEKINDRLSKNEQVILLLNRRGFSTLIMCRNCGHVHVCPNCDVSLTKHKEFNIMRCHYCGYADKVNYKCPKCMSTDYKELGTGTEKLEHELKMVFKTARVVRMDLDTTTKKGSHAKIINDFTDHKYDILLGTQMIAKGLDFPKVTLVGVINADSSLNIPDFRSSERTFQLLSQVSGRAGRKDLEGEVIIQSFNNNHYSIVTAKEHNYKEFYLKEMTLRKQLKYSPYYYLVSIVISSKDSDLAFKQGLKIRNYLLDTLNKETIILGPTVSNIAKINNIYYYKCIIKYRFDDKVYNSLNSILDKYKNDNKVNIDIDINPVSL